LPYAFGLKAFLHGTQLAACQAMRLRWPCALIVVLGTLALAPAAAAQVELAAGVASISEDSVRPRVTVRLHAGPNLNVMRDWRDGLDLLEGLAQERGLPITDESCICMSWGTTALTHITKQLAIGGEFEVLRDTRKFTVDDQLRAFGINETASFAFRNETVVQTSLGVTTCDRRDAVGLPSEVSGSWLRERLRPEIRVSNEPESEGINGQLKPR
jgi:hypothetical protein